MMMGLILNNKNSPHGEHQQEAEGMEITIEEEEHPSRAVVEVSKKNRRRRSRRLERRSARTMSGFCFSSSLPLCVFWWLVFLEVLAVDNNFLFKASFQFFSVLPRAEARPLEYEMEEEVCTATLQFAKPQSSSTYSTTKVGLAEFGKSASDIDCDGDALLFLTVLPENYNSLCDEDGDFAFLESVQNGISDHYPKGKIALLVDLAAGDCDVRTKATNALKLQKKIMSLEPRSKLQLNYVLFYVSRYNLDQKFWGSIPKLSLDDNHNYSKTLTRGETSASTSNPTSNPTMGVTFAPTTKPKCFLTYPSSFSHPSSHPSPWPSVSSEPSVFLGSSTHPFPAPSVSSKPSVSLGPSSHPSSHPSPAPSVSSKPSVSLGPSSHPSPAPFVSSEPSVSLGPSSHPSSHPSPAPSVSSEPSVSLGPSSAPSVSSKPSEDTSTSLPTDKKTGSNDADAIDNNIFDNNSPRERELNSKNREQGRELQELTVEREYQKVIIEENKSMVFLSISTTSAQSILLSIDKEEIFHPFCENSFLYTKILLTDEFMISPACNRGHDYHNGHGQPPTRQPQQTLTRQPQQTPTRQPQQTPTSKPTNGGSYPENAPGSFTIFKFVLFGLLIASPCLRVAHQWWAAGGRIRLRRSNDGYSNHVVGLQYIPPMDYWFGGSAPESSEVPRTHDRLTHQEVVNLPEIIYTKLVHSDDVDVVETKENATKQPIIEEEDHGSSRHLYNEDDDDHSDNGIGIGISIGTASTTETTETVDAPSETTASSGTTTIDEQPIEEEEMESDESIVSQSDESIVSEATFENEPSTTILQLPTSPERVNSSTINTNTSGDEPLSPRAIVPTEELPPDEERPEEQQQLQQPQPTTNITTQQQQQESAAPQQQQQHLSFRTQRRLRNFTTTTCTACSICIDEFEEGEKVRLLPLCGHGFHTECILPWLTDRHGCCPLCKTGVLDQNNSNNNQG